MTEKRISLFSRTRLFSTPSRVRLFSETPRIALFSKEEEKERCASEDEEFVCQDCGKHFIPKNKKHPRCENCGSSNVVPEEELPELEDEKEAIDETLKEYSDKSVDTEEAVRIFAERGINLSEVIDAGCAYTEGSQVCFSELADVTYRVFSSLGESIAQDLSLIPIHNSKEALIQKLEDSMTVPDKCIVMIKKAHYVLHPKHESADSEDYLSDSGIKTGLAEEFGHGHEMSLPEFAEVLKEQYNDAPEDITEQLTKADVISISGDGKVKIN